MNKKLLFAAMLVLVSMMNPGCKHDQMDSKKLYLKYLKNHIK